jgi:Trk-type K+ transport system membrane component
VLVAIVLFAFSTMISWSYYGMKAWTYLFGEGKVKEYIYKGVFLVFIVIVSASSLGNVGPSIGDFGPSSNFYDLPVLAKWWSSFLMLLGRLELYTVLIIITPYFWRNT